MNYKKAVSSLAEMVNNNGDDFSIFAVAIEHKSDGNANISISGSEKEILRAITHAMWRDERARNLVKKALVIYERMEENGL